MTINVTPASQELTSVHNYNKAAERALIVRKRRAFLKTGGQIGVYREGDKASAMPVAARRMLPTMNREIHGDAAEYFKGYMAYLDAKRAKAEATRAKAYATRLATAAALSASLS